VVVDLSDHFGSGILKDGDIIRAMWVDEDRSVDMVVGRDGENLGVSIPAPEDHTGMKQGYDGKWRWL
jgi:hypothetical protein